MLHVYSIYIYLHINIYIHVYIHTYIYICRRVLLCMTNDRYIFLCIHACIYVCMLCIHLNMHRCMHLLSFSPSLFSRVSPLFTLKLPNCEWKFLRTWCAVTCTLYDTHAHTHTYTNTYACTHTRTHVRSHARTRTYRTVGFQVDKNTHAQKRHTHMTHSLSLSLSHTHTRTHTHTCVYTLTHTRISVCTHAELLDLKSKNLGVPRVLYAQTDSIFVLFPDSSPAQVYCGVVCFCV